MLSAMADKAGLVATAKPAGQAETAGPAARTAEMVLGSWARTRSGIFTRADARAAGLSNDAIKARLRRGLWVAEYGRGLRAVTTPRTVAAQERLALARAGSGAALSHLSAARRWGLVIPTPEEVWVTVAASRNPRPRPGLRFVRSRHMSPELVRLVDGVPVLDPARTVADLGLFYDERELTAIALSALQRGLCRLDDIRAWCEKLSGRPGSGVLRRALAEADPAVESILAAEFLELTAAAGIHLEPGYVLYLPDGGQVVCDFADLAGRIDVEVDGLAYHSTPAQVARDKARDRRLLAAGWVTVRYDTNDVRRRPRETVADLHRQRTTRYALLSVRG
jgi:uncharacterized protein DUF559